MATNVQFLLLALIYLPGCASFQWSSSSPPDGQVVYVCRGATVLIPWQYLLDANDTVGDVTWLYDGHSQEIIAIMTHGQFLVMPAFSHRVQASGSAGLSLTGVQVGDSGNYSIEVQGFHDSGASHSQQHVLIRHSVFLHVSDQLMTVDGSVHVTQSSEVILDPRSGQYSVQLQCGQFVFADNPPFQMEWVTPDGHVVNSSDFNDHHFTLILPPPIKGGNYSCRIPPQHADLACLHGNAGHQGEATVMVDKVDAQLSILMKENQQLTERLNRTDSTLASTQNELSQTQQQLSSQQSRLQKLEDAARHQVAFHATNLQSRQPPSGTPLIFNNIHYNQGQAYNAGTGYFTAPFAGAYYFIATTDCEDSNSYAHFYLCVDDTVIGSGFSFWDGVLGHVIYNSVHGVAHLNVGQRVWIKGDGSQYASYNDNTKFSGFLLYHDF